MGLEAGAALETEDANNKRLKNANATEYFDLRDRKHSSMKDQESLTVT
jgi:hypothetical protein